MLPRREFDGWLKQVNPEDLSDLQRLALQLIFPHLMPPSREAVDEWVDEMREDETADHVIGSYVNNRRFAGDFTLGARRYFTLAHGPNGNDHGTLAAELAAYYDDRIGPCDLGDFVTKEQAANYGVPYQEQSLLIRVQGTPGSSAVVARLGTNAVWIPYRVEHVQISNVIDLRYPEVQEWFCREFAEIHKSVTLELRKHVRAGVDPSELELPGYDPPASFFEMLPVLMDPARGGNGVTNHVGQWMRRQSVAALIYASARTQTGVVWRQDAMARFPGWNLVDYRGTGDQFLDGLTLFLGADPWSSEYAEDFDLETGAGNSWMMSPPAGVWKSPEILVSDDDLKIRYHAGKNVFTALIYMASAISQDEELGWLDAIFEACNTPRGRRILDWMGITSVHDFGEASETTERAVLFECSTISSTAGRASKGYACLPGPPAKTFQSLDTEPDNYMLGEPAFCELEEGLYTYYLREGSA